MLIFLFEEEFKGGLVLELLLLFVVTGLLLLLDFPRLLPVSLSIACLCFSRSAAVNSRFLTSTLEDFTDPESFDLVVLLNLCGPVFLRFCLLLELLFALVLLFPN